MTPSFPSDIARQSIHLMASRLASEVAKQSLLGSSQIHLVPGADHTRLFVSNGSRYYKIADTTAAHLQQLIQQGDEAAKPNSLPVLALS